MAECPKPHPLFARIYTRLSKSADAAGAAAHRERLLAGLAGEVVELGAGNGLNFGHYPATVTRVHAVEPEPYLRDRATEAARTATIPVTVVEGSADELPLPDMSVDAGVASLVLCSVPDQPRALAELHRVIRPGGELRFYEHVLAADPRWARRQRRIDPIWTRVAGGCHLTRTTAGAIADAGFEIEEQEDFLFSTALVDRLAASHTLGRARRP